MTEHLQGKIAIITGGGTGIGQGIARAFSRNGIKVVICGRRLEKLIATCDDIVKEGFEATAVQADVSRIEDVERIVKATLDAYKRIDVLVNNAGIGGSGPVHAHQISVWDQVMNINLYGPFLMTRAVLPYMREQESGHIFNISSESGLEYYSGNGAYGVSKHALNAFSEYIQRENQDKNIRVNTICPGMVVTEMTEDSPGLDHSKCLYPEDIAELVLWLLSRRSNIKIGTPILIQTMLNPWDD